MTGPLTTGTCGPAEPSDRGIRAAIGPARQRPFRPAQTARSPVSRLKTGWALPVMAEPVIAERHLCPALSREEPHDGRRRIDLTLPRPHNLGAASTNSAQDRTSLLQFVRGRSSLYRQHHAARAYQ